jgi:CheY-like chemotaxis protein
MVILNDILDFSKIEAGKLHIEAVDFPLASTLTEILTPIGARATQKGLALIIQLAPDLPDHVLGDFGRIRQILTNLCDNAIKFTAKGSVTVHVQSKPVGDEAFEVHLSVRDTGIGIPPDKQQGIFEAFSQADNSTTRRFGGTGLGLTISTRLVELMGGRIWVESTSGVGSTFHFTVRMGRSRTSTSALVAAPVAPPPTPALRPLQVLLVEDNPVNQMLSTLLLEKWGHTVVTAENGQEAVDLFPTQHWDIVLMDMQMPVMGGLEATTLIRAMEPADRHVPIIAVTANAMESDRDACQQAGMDEHLAKPMKAAELQAMLARFCAPGMPV